jgi:hypothetical protein
MLTEKGESQIKNIDYAVKGMAILGAVAGVVYSAKSGGGFWRGVGYFFLGSLVVGGVTRLATLPMKNKVISQETK